MPSYGILAIVCSKHILPIKDHIATYVQQPRQSESPGLPAIWRLFKHLTGQKAFTAIIQIMEKKNKIQRSDSWQYSFLRCGVLWVFPGATFISLTFRNVLDLHSQMCSPGFRISKIMVNIIICCSWHKRIVKILFHNAVLLPGKHALYAATVSSGFAWAQEHASIFFGSLCALYS